MTTFTIAGLSDAQGRKIADLLQTQLSTYNDLHLTLKHVHWNVVGPNFIGVHEMLDPQVDLVRGYADEVAERIAALGRSPQGTPGAILKDRTWDDYSVGRDTVQAHLAALNLVYDGVIADTRTAIKTLDDLPRVAGLVDWARRRTREVPVVRACASGEFRRSAGRWRCEHREEGCGSGQEKGARQVTGMVRAARMC